MRFSTTFAAKIPEKRHVRRSQKNAEKLSFQFFIDNILHLFFCVVNRKAATRTALLYSDGLGKVSRFVHVPAEFHGDVVCQKLQRDYRHDAADKAPDDRQ